MPIYNRNAIPLKKTKGMVILIHALQFGGSHVFIKEIYGSFEVVWLASIWFIWKEQNARIFNNKQIFLEQLPKCVKLRSWWWLKSHELSHFVDFHSLWSNPSLCKGFTTM